MFTFALDKERLYRHFEKDPALFAYHIGDLDDAIFPECQFAAIYDRTAKIDDVALIYNGGKIPAVHAFGLTDRYGEFLTELLDILPAQFLGHYFESYRPIFLSRYDETPAGSLYRMKLEQPNDLDLHPEIKPQQIVRLTAEDTPKLIALYAEAYPDSWFDPRLLATGKYFGYVRYGRLVAVAGVHVYSPTYKMAVLGNIATLPPFRGEGIATALTGILTHELAEEGLGICLNVQTENAAAVRVYTKLGFATAHQYAVAAFSEKKAQGKTKEATRAASRKKSKR